MLVTPSRAPLALAVATAALLLLLAASLGVGAFPLSVPEALAILWEMLRGEPAAATGEASRAILLDVRGPRIAAALAVGAALAVSGSALQGVLRNPLVSPDILGVSSGCALGAVVGILLGWPAAGLQAMAFAGGLAAAGLVMAIGARVRGSDPVLALVLTGVVIGAMLSAGVAFVKTVADPFNQLPAITFWLLGSFGGVMREDLAAALLPMVAGVAVLAALRWRIDVLALPDDEARALGVDAPRLRLAVVLAATLLTSAAVAIAGIIGWVGLVVPHAARLVAGAGFARVLPFSALLGATFMLLVDTLCRGLGEAELPPGVITALAGTPAFLVLLALSARRSA